jgi:16S rRNA (cytidine1402-2'-O)-methyltransferase
VCRELTKLHEEIACGDLAALAHEFGAEGRARGEIAIVIAPPAANHAFGTSDVEALLREALERLSLKEAVAEIAAVTGEPRRSVYQRALALAKERQDAR